MAESCAAVLFTQIRFIAIFEHNISQASVATRLMCDGIFNYFVTRNLLLSLSAKRILKIGEHLAKLEAK